MKKHRNLLTRIWLICLCLMLAMPLTALADEESEDVSNPSQGGARVEGQFVYDYANLLENEEELEAEIARIRDAWEIDAVIVTIDDAHGLSAMEYADDFFDYNGFGYNEPMGDGVLFLIDMDNREIWISTCGKAIIFFTDDRIDEALDDIIEYMYDMDYDGAASEFLWYTDDFMGRAPGNYDPYEESQTPPFEKEEGRFVYDMAGMLDNDELLEKKIADVNSRFAAEIVILTVEDTGGLMLYTYAKDFFVYNDFGVNGDGVLLAFDQSGYSELIPFGNVGYEKLTGERCSLLNDEYRDVLVRDDYSAACAYFVDRVAQFMEKPYSGTGLDMMTVGYRFRNVLSRSGLFMAVAAVFISAVVTLFRVIAGKVKKVKADQYLNETGGFAMSIVQDTFMGQYTTRTYSPVSENNSSGGSSGGGGSSTHSSSSGTSHGGGGRSF